MRKLFLSAGGCALILCSVSLLRGDEKDGWIDIFNGKDLSGWKLRDEKVTETQFVDAEGKTIPGARKVKVDQKDVVLDAKGKEVPGAKLEVKDGKKTYLTPEGVFVVGAKAA